jgi:hypothetical protein
MMLSKISSLFVGDATGRSILEEFRVALDPAEVLSGAAARRRSGTATAVIAQPKGEGRELALASCITNQFRGKHL